MTEAASSRRPVPGDRLRLVPGAAVLVLAVSVVLLGVAVAARPARLDAAEPAAGAQLSVPPAAVRLSFTRPVDPKRAHVGVFDQRSVAVGEGQPVVAGATVTQAVQIGAGGGYQVRYHIGFDDGDHLAGTLAFTVAGGVILDGVDPAGRVTLDGGDRAGGAARSARPDETPVGAGHGHAADPLTVVILGVDGLVLVAAAVAVVLRRRTRSRNITI